jgi:hypothetical protein
MLPANPQLNLPQERVAGLIPGSLSMHCPIKNEIPVKVDMTRQKM